MSITSLPTSKTFSSLVSSKLPSFIRDDHQTLSLFLKYYFQWLEQSRKAYSVVDRLDSYQDIDETTDDFLLTILKELAPNLPLETASDKRFIAKQIHELYKAKGSLDSYRLLFRLIYGEEIDFYFPGRDVLRPSDNFFKSQTFLYLSTNNDLAVISLKGKRITGSVSGATAVVSEVILEGSTAVLELSPKFIEGTFAANDEIEFTVGEDTFVETIIRSVSGVVINDGGTGYSIGDEIVLSGGGGSGAQARVTNVSKGKIEDYVINDGGSGYSIGDEIEFAFVSGATPAKARVSNVSSGVITEISIYSRGNNYSVIPSFTIDSAGSGADIEFLSDSIGSIKEVEIIASGRGYTSVPSVSISSDNGSGASLSFSLGTTYQTPGRFTSARGFLSDVIRLHDGRFYQDYSYVIKSSISQNEWGSLVDLFVHPAGEIYFSSTLIIDLADVSITALEYVFTQHYVFDTADISITVIESTGAEVQYVFEPDSSLGATYGDFDQFKFINNSNVGNFFDIQIEPFFTSPDDEFSYGIDPVIILPTSLLTGQPVGLLLSITEA